MLPLISNYILLEAVEQITLLLSWNIERSFEDLQRKTNILEEIRKDKMCLRAQLDWYEFGMNIA